MTRKIASYAIKCQCTPLKIVLTLAWSTDVSLNPDTTMFAFLLSEKFIELMTEILVWYVATADNMAEMAAGDLCCHINVVLSACVSFC